MTKVRYLDSDMGQVLNNRCAKEEAVEARCGWSVGSRCGRSVDGLKSRSLGCRFAERQDCPG